MQKDEGRLYNIAQAAAELGLHESSVRRIVIAMHQQGMPVGRKHNGRGWLLTSEDIRRIRERPDNRGDWQRHGGRRSYLDRLRRERDTRAVEG